MASTSVTDDTVVGTFKSDQAGNFNGAFIVGVTRTFSGAFSSAVPGFTSLQATLDYQPDTLVGTYTIQVGSTVGPEQLNITATNEATDQTIKITGPISPPIDKGYSVTGSGRWSSTEDDDDYAEETVADEAA
ncbi:hypothetical protein B0T24DRAFT_590163 [Lasiosphaeria ovina]|uniref:Uncharacterized protein n=1 Tax=Lasiosphaeria ovina TaxID=92902 RepID=A0AAE0TSP4_9PEZI|nr:hypothetical protein B0T24DRAFT_590163 [Lasiosphaeria ovina]